MKKSNKTVQWMLAAAIFVFIAGPALAAGVDDIYWRRSQISSEINDLESEVRTLTSQLTNVKKDFDQAKKTADDAKKELEQAQTEVKDTRKAVEAAAKANTDAIAARAAVLKKITSAKETAPENVAIKKEMEEAVLALSKIQDTILTALREKIEYKRAVDDQMKAKKELVDAQASPDSTSVEISEHATLWMEKQTVVTKIEQEAYKASKEWVDASSRAEAARKAYADMRKTIESTVKIDPEYAEADKAVSDATASIKEAQAAADAARKKESTSRQTMNLSTGKMNQIASVGGQMEKRKIDRERRIRQLQDELFRLR